MWHILLCILFKVCIKSKYKMLYHSVLTRDAITVISVSPTEVKVCWDLEEFGEVESLALFYKAKSQNDEDYRSVNLKNDDSSCIIAALVPNTIYQIKMEADGLDKSEIKTEVVEISTRKAGKIGFTFRFSLRVITRFVRYSIETFNHVNSGFV